MNFKIHTSLNGQTFNIEEDAYQKLTEYRRAISEAYSTYNDGAEIISDIDMRITEILSESVSLTDSTVTTRHIDNVIDMIGDPKMLTPDADDNNPVPTCAGPTGSRGVLSNPRAWVYGILWIILLPAVLYLMAESVIMLVKTVFAFFGTEIWRCDPLHGKWIINPALYQYGAAPYALLWILSCIAVIGIPLGTLFYKTTNSLKHVVGRATHAVSRRTRIRLTTIWAGLLIVAISGYFIMQYCISHSYWELIDQL